MANISLYERENETPGNQNPAPDVIINTEAVNNDEKKEELPSLIVPVTVAVASLLAWRTLF
jgi:hypothetical protein